MIKSLRFRISAWYLGFFSLLFVVFSLFLHGLLARSLQHRMDEALSMEANTAAALLEDEFGEMKGDAARAVTEVLPDLRLRGNTAAFFAGTRLIGASTPVPSNELAEIQENIRSSLSADTLFTVTSAGSNGARAAVHRIKLGGQDYNAVVAQPLDAILADLDVLRRILLIALPLIIALAGIGGYWLTTRNLAPLASMAEQARHITGSNLNTRLHVGDAAQELTTLSASFNELLARLDQSFENMRRFVGDASHELRTPIAVIRGEADVALSTDRQADEYKQTLAVILDESRRLSRLVDDLLNLARADAGRVRLQVQDFYLDELLTECCRSAKSLASSRGVALDCCAPADVVFRGDQELLHRMAMNLIDNAIRYTPRGGSVRVDLDARDGELSIRVADTGVGIAVDALPHVFERFYRADKARSRQDGGFGLGLAIVKWIAELHGGAVAVVSPPGKGTTFTATLPR